MAKTDSTTNRIEIADDGTASVAVSPGLGLDVRTASGDVTVTKGDGGACRIRFRARGGSLDRLLPDVRCEYSETSNTLFIETRPFDGGRSGSWGRFFNFGGHDLDVFLEVPDLATVRMRTASGDVSVAVTASSIDVNTASGDLSVADVVGPVSYHSASGDLRADSVTGTLGVKSASGDVNIGSLSGDATIQSVSGDVTATIVEPVRLKANLVSGDVEIGIRRGLVVDIDASTVSGSLKSEIDFSGSAGAGGEVATGDSPVRLQVKTVSGDVKVRRA
jgi:DUF4097 and DUF4098 domain-containing protein YvlB